ncbi:MAG: hypothetical protein NT076_01345 [Candidatus Pacearchaeota archaeon]|nr:hypothetical protein [Candidatus Pacearchaeota archaeon]
MKQKEISAVIRAGYEDGMRYKPRKLPVGSQSAEVYARAYFHGRLVYKDLIPLDLLCGFRSLVPPNTPSPEEVTEAISNARRHCNIGKLEFVPAYMGLA